MNKHLSYTIPSVLIFGILISIFLTKTTYAKVENYASIEQRAYAYFQNLPDDHNMIEASELFDKIEAKEDLFIIDIRNPEEYQNGHIKGAVNVIFADASIPEALERIPSDKQVIVYCSTGQDSAQVATILKLAGKSAKSIHFGFNSTMIQAQANTEFIEQTSNSLPQGNYPVAAKTHKIIFAYFTDKMVKDGTPFANYNVSAQTVNNIIQAQNDNYLLVSILQPDEYAVKHIPTSENIPYGKGMEEDLVSLPKNKIILVQCETGQTSSQTVAVLRILGYDSYSMTDGITAWMANKFNLASL